MPALNDSQNNMKSSYDKASGEPNALLELGGISKAFPGILANDAIDLRVMPGEIHGLVGENGAGKSPLVKIIYGLLWKILPWPSTKNGKHKNRDLG